MQFILLIPHIVFIIPIVHSLPPRCIAQSTADEASTRAFLCGDYEQEMSSMCNKAAQASWDHLIDLANKTKDEVLTNITVDNAKKEKAFWKNYFKDLDPLTYEDTNLIREIKRLSILGNAALEGDQLAELTKTIEIMTRIYATAKICPYNNPKCNETTEGLSLDPDIETIMATSTDYDELLYVWSAWRDATGGKMKRDYEIYVELSNEAARANNFSDKGEMWRAEYESPNLRSDLERIWSEVEPLYLELHEYVLRKLRCHYRKDMGPDDDGLIPAHLLGNMWAQSWIHLRKLVKPFPDVPDIDVTGALQEKGYTVLKMFQAANEFYTSIGLKDMSSAYDTKKGAVIEKSSEREMLCHASAWDFCNRKDFRIKMCANVTFKDFITIHHELGHIQYYMQYENKTISFRTGANPGFHEAIGDTISLSVATPHHLKTIGLIDNYTDSMQMTINALMDMALERVAFLPYGYLLDKWRWDIFSEKFDPDHWNAHYWNYRAKYQRVKAPLQRHDEDFDPGAKFHVPGDAQYISYFFAHILEFQIFRSLCRTTTYYRNDGMLYKCDIYKSKPAGQLLEAGLKLGASKHWTYVLDKVTDESYLSAGALLEYFEPLYKYLVYVNDMETPKR